MRNFFACSVGEPTKGYDEQNLKRIISSKAFVLHKDTKQKGVYDDIMPGDILLLKYNKNFVAYGETTGRKTTNDEEWNLTAPVYEWNFKDANNPKLGVETYGIQWSTLEGAGQMGTVKELDEKFGIEKIKKIDDNTQLFKNIIQEISKRKKMQQVIDNVKLIEYKKQIILQGPPGTGKTRLAKLLAKQIVKETLLIDDRTIKSLLSVGLKIPSSTEYTEYTILDIGVLNITLELKDLKSQYKPSFKEIINAFNIKMWDGKQVKGNDPYAAAIAKYVYDHLPDNNISLIQFHPSFTYEDFVRGISVDINNNLPEYIVKNRILVEMAEKALDNPSLNFVLIIDEINRANLPAVLGELIYALEYRYDPDNPKDTTVESLYGIKNKDTSTLNRELRLPKNLFIIGTMNTADRSVGHIDYAIRRRFAFVDILPNPEPVHPDVKGIFATVSELFIKDLSEYIQTVKLERSECLASDFRPEDVWLGHSYFICKDKDEKDLPSLEAKSILLNKIKYEVIPILKEYIKDGILLDYDKTKAAIQSLSNWS